MEQGVHVEDHPNEYRRHATKAPAIVNVCDTAPSGPLRLEAHGIHGGAACGRIVWDMMYGMPLTGLPYTASVPPRVDLSEQGLWWEPSVHCITWDQRRRATTKVDSGSHCMNIIDAETQRMEWMIGGVIHGLDPEAHGIYEGWIPMTITDGDNVWILDVPLRYERFRADPTCSLATGDIYVRNLPYVVEGGGALTGGFELSSGSLTRDILEYTNELEDYCKANDTECSGVTYETGYARIKTDSPTWSMSLPKVVIKPGSGSTGKEEDWKWIVGYYSTDRTTSYQIAKGESLAFTESNVTSPYVDGDGFLHLFLGGSVSFSNWKTTRNRGSSFSGSATVTFTCG